MPKLDKGDKPGFFNSKRKLPFAIAMFLAFSGLTWWLLGGVNFGAARTIEDMVASSPEINALEATNELCAESGCLEGWRTNVGSFLRFKSEGQAEYWATLLGDAGRRNENLVLDMRDLELSFEQKKLAIEVLYSNRDWY